MKSAHLLMLYQIPFRFVIRLKINGEVMRGTSSPEYVLTHYLSWKSSFEVDHRSFNWNFLPKQFRESGPLEGPSEINGRDESELKGLSD